ncbi:hypothetical protein ACFQL9_13150 [Halobaculum lipolyticum]|uniref:Uncharacterized protein n=1 Tax=Halobaculum lipolyticum TaxID=3032001 RepID=A0ABD5WF51_9EURY
MTDISDTIDQLTSRIETLEADRDRLESLADAQADKIDDLEETVEERSTRIEELTDTVENQAATIADLEGTVERLETRVDHRHEKNLELLNETVIGDGGYLLDEQEAWLNDHGSLLEYLVSAGDHTDSTGSNTTVSADVMDRVSHETAKLRRKLHSVADAAGISTEATTEAAAHEDKLNRLLRYGPTDVTDTVYAVHNRARDLLEHAGDWGRKTSDSLGTRITLTASAVKERLSLKRGESLSSTEVRRVFEKLEALASDSPRKVVADTGGRGRNRLVIYLTDAEVERTA